MPESDGVLKVEFFFVGVGKAGTSWLYEFLSRHPGVSVPTIKEPYIADLPPAKQAAAVQRLYKGTQRLCDFSNTYFWDPDNPRKLIEHNPGAKVILTVRKPSERILSHFEFLQRSGEHVGKSLAEYINGGDPDDIVGRSRYAQILGRYRAHFAEDRILVMPLELLKADPQAYADRLLRFLDLPSMPIEQEDAKPVRKVARARNAFAARTSRRLAAELRRMRLLSLLGWLKNNRAINALLFAPKADRAAAEFGTMTPEVEALDASYPADFLEPAGLGGDGGSAA